MEIYRERKGILLTGMIEIMARGGRRRKKTALPLLPPVEPVRFSCSRPGTPSPHARLGKMGTMLFHRQIHIYNECTVGRTETQPEFIFTITFFTL